MITAWRAHIPPVHALYVTVALAGTMLAFFGAMLGWRSADRWWAAAQRILDRPSNQFLWHALVKDNDMREHPTTKDFNRVWPDLLDIAEGKPPSIYARFGLRQYERPSAEQQQLATDLLIDGDDIVAAHCASGAGRCYAIAACIALVLIFHPI